jgi:hypothetical protein
MGALALVLGIAAIEPAEHFFQDHYDVAVDQR